MSSKLTLKIKDFPMRNASVTFPVISAVTSEKIVGSTRIPKLVVRRKSDTNTVRFLIRADWRKIKPNDSGLNLPILTLTFEKHDTDGKILSSTTKDFFDAVVETIKPDKDEEEITFLADRTSFEFTISNVVVSFD